MNLSFFFNKFKFTFFVMYPFVKLTFICQITFNSIDVRSSTDVNVHNQLYAVANPGGNHSISPFSITHHPPLFYYLVDISYRYLYSIFLYNSGLFYYKYYNIFYCGDVPLGTKFVPGDRDVTLQGRPLLSSYLPHTPLLFLIIIFVKISQPRAPQQCLLMQTLISHKS